eukprot:9495574-Pyramimonas_sp.AAC.2
MLSCVAPPGACQDSRSGPPPQASPAPTALTVGCTAYCPAAHSRSTRAAAPLQRRADCASQIDNQKNATPCGMDLLNFNGTNLVLGNDLTSKCDEDGWGPLFARCKIGFQFPREGARCA